MITPLFSVPIYTSKFIRSLNDQEKDCIKSIKKNTKANQNNLISTSYRIFDDYQGLSEIKDFIQTHINQYTFEVCSFSRKDKCYITTSWLNITKPEQSHHVHNHPNSYISGVFYIDTLENDTLMFHSPFSTNFINIGVNGMGIYPDMARQRVFDLDLVLFPSYLKHEVYRNKTKKNRVSISFNTFVKTSIDANVSSLNIL